MEKRINVTKSEAEMKANGDMQSASEKYPL